jgi:DNA-binding LacI/PurR family transcriptional regulator
VRNRPLTDRVASLLRRQIGEGRFRNGRLPDERKLTEIYEVSRGTIRSALRRLEDEDLIVRVQGKGTLISAGASELLRPAKRLGLVCGTYSQVNPGQTVIGGGYFGELLGGLTMATAASNHDLVVYGSVNPDSTAAWIEGLDTGEVQGLLLMAVDDQRVLKLLAGSSIPLVLVDHRTEVADIDCVDIDSRGGAADAVAYLHSLGHDRIAYIDWEQRELSRERFRGYLDGLEQARLPRNSQWIATGPSNEIGGGRGLSRILGAGQRPTAVLVFSDTMARGTVRAAAEMNIRVPEDLSIMGFGDLPQARNEEPWLTTMRVDCRQMGAAAVDRLLARIADPKAETTTQLIPASLEIRGTCAPPGRIP